MVGSMALAAGLQSLFEDLSSLWRLRAPFYADIKNAAWEYDLSPSLLSALLWKESRFRPDALGSSGEIGLGQMMPGAASDVGIALDDLRGNVRLQIFKAAQFLRLQIDRAGGDILLGVRAYNAGLRGARNNPSLSVSYAAHILGLSSLDVLLSALGRGERA